MRKRSRTLGGITRRPRVVGLIVALILVLPLSSASAQDADPREGLEPGVQNAGEAASNMVLEQHLPKPPGFSDPANPFSSQFWNSDLTFTGNHAIMGNYNGFLVYDISDPENASLRTAAVCPGGQGDVSVSGDLLFISVQQFGTVECEQQGTPDTQVFEGVRVFDISDLDNPQQVAAVQTCRGSHSHTILEPPNDDDNVYVYVHGTGGVREDNDVEGLDCVLGPDSNDPADFLDAEGNPVETDRFQIEVIEVPRDNPDQAEIVSEPRLFEDPETGNPHGLNPGEGAATTDACHDITTYPEIGLAAGACEGNGLLIDISDPVNPERIDFVTDDVNFAYWHSATFNNEGTKVVFTDELGGGGQATCTPDVPQELGANAIYDIVDDNGELSMEFASYYKIPNNQTDTENCVAHNGSIVPVPGRDIMVQAWYQGGISVFDFTDSENPEEIAFFDRGPVDADQLGIGGFWSAYWYNGHIYGSEIVRGFDVFELTESEHLSEEELEAAESVRLDQFNAQMQPQIDDADRSACGGIEGMDFPDVDDETHAETIRCIGGFGIAQGYVDGTFGSNDSITRDQMATFLTNELEVAGVDLPDSPADAFGDDEGNTHELEINQLAELGIVSGVGDDRYDPRGNVTRAQMATFLVHTAEVALGEDLPGAGRSPFTDVSSSSTHAANIDIAYDVGLTVGVTETLYAPNNDVTRAQMASFIVRSLETLRLRNVVLTPSPLNG